MSKPASLSLNDHSKPTLAKLFKWLFVFKTRWLKWVSARWRKKAADAPLAKGVGYPRWTEVAIFQDEIDVVKQRESSQRIDKESVRLPE